MNLDPLLHNLIVQIDMSKNTMFCGDGNNNSCVFNGMMINKMIRACL